MPAGNFILSDASGTPPVTVHATDAGQFVKPGGARSFADRFGANPAGKLVATIVGNKMTPTIIPPASPLLP